MSTTTGDWADDPAVDLAEVNRRRDELTTRTTTTAGAWLNDPALHAELLASMRAHRDADAIIGWQYVIPDGAA